MNASDIIKNLARPAVQQLTPYSSARSESGVNNHITLWLDANESPWPPYLPDGVQLADLADSRRYEYQQPPALVDAMARVYGVEKDQLLIGRGADEAIELLVRVFCEKGESSIIQCSPTFGMYEVAAAVEGVSVLDVPLLKEPTDDGHYFQLDMPLLRRMIDHEPALLFLCSPGNPTGTLLNTADIIEVCKTATNSLVVADEAYIEFADTNSLTSLLTKFPNLVLLRTLSKAYSLAGERLGAMLAAPEVVELCGRVLAPYPLSATACGIAVQALSEAGLEVQQERIAIIKAERERLFNTLADIDGVVFVYPSDTNFLLLAVEDATAFCAKLAAAGIKIRNRSKDIPNHVRITIGTPEQNDRVLTALAK